MTVTDRDKRALMILGAAVAVILVVNYFLTREPQAAPVAGPNSITLAEKRLERLRRIAVTLPEREAALKTLSGALAQRDKALIQADTAAQAQAQLLQIFRRLARAQAPAIEIKTVEMGQIRPLGEDYGEIIVPVTFECRIEQLLNLLADITAQPELLSTSEMRIVAANQKEKTMTVRLTLAGVAPKRLAPQKKGQASL
jgi:hypothetical protein